MKERLNQLLDMEHLSPSKFADLIGVQRSSVSHVLSGRNKPSFDFLEKTLKSFPGLEADWLILGKGQMYENMGRNEGLELFNDEVKTEASDESDTLREDSSVDEEPVHQSSPNEKKVVRVLIFYDDNTFSNYSPSD